MKFTYNQKEVYTQADVEELFAQHEGFVKKQFKDYVSKEDYEKIFNELKPYKAEKRSNHITSLVKDLTDDKKLDAAIRLAAISEEDDDNSIISKVSDVIKQNDFLAKTPVVDPAGTKPAVEKPTKQVLDVKAPTGKDIALKNL